jgi:hypothetical protein
MSTDPTQAESRQLPFPGGFPGECGTESRFPRLSYL